MHHNEDTKSKWSLWVNKDKYKPIASQKTTSRAKPKTKHQAPTHLWKLYEETVIESEARTTVVQFKSKT